MFDFTNYTYSAALTIISTLFGLAYPLILGCIEKIDSRFNSTSLSSRFKKESDFIYFKRILLVNLIISVTFPFILDDNNKARFFITFQIIMVVLLIFLVLKLFNKIMIYYDPNDLQKLIIKDYNKARESSDKEKESLFFSQWADLTAVLLSSADNKMVMSVYSVWDDYVKRFVESNVGKENLYDIYFYNAITRINENLCKGERRPITINNSNSILEVFINPTDKISQTSYIFLWKNLKIQLYYGREDWVFKYWQYAAARYISLNQLENTDKQYTKKQEDFLEFHTVLCALMLHEKKYDIFSKMIYYSSSGGRDYPLIPSRLSSIISMFHVFYQRAERELNYFEKRYSVSSLYGLNDNETLGILFQYLAVLIYRLYTIVWFNGPNMVFDGANIPKSLIELSSYKDEIDCVKYWVRKIHSSRELLSTLDIENFDDFFRELQKNRYSGNYKILPPVAYIDKITSDIEESMNYLNINQEYDTKKVNQLFYSITHKIKGIKKEYKYFNGSEKDLIQSYLDCSTIQFYPNAAFIDKANICYENIDGSIAHSLIYKFTHYFASMFYVQNAQDIYTVANSDILKVLNKLQLNNEQVVISFDIHWDYYIDRGESVTKINDTEYKYNDIQIINLRCPERALGQTVYIINKSDLPILSYKKATESDIKKYELKEFNKSIHLYLSVLKVKDKKELVNTYYLKKQNLNEDTYSFITAIWKPQLAFKPNISLVKMTIKYAGLDEGICTNLNQIKPFNNRNKSYKG